MTARPNPPLLHWIRPGQWLVIDTLAGVGYGLLAFLALANGASSAGEWLAASPERSASRYQWRPGVGHLRRLSWSCWRRSK